MSEISVCYSGNRRVFPGLLLSVLSLVRHTDRPLHVFVLSMDLRGEDPAFLPFSQAQQDLLGRVVREKNADSRVFFLDMTERYRAALAHGKNKKNFYTPYAQLRLFLGELEGIPDKILYLDVDTMCLSDIGQLYDTDIAGFEYGAVLDHMGKFWISPTYCNSGVLLLNLPRLRETKLLQRCPPLQRAAGAARGHRRQTLLPRHPLGPLLPHLQLQAVGARKSARKAPPALL